MSPVSDGTNIAHSRTVGNGKAMTKRVLASAPGVPYDDQRQWRTDTLRNSGCGGRMDQDITGLKVGDMAPPFALQVGDGQTLRLTDVLGCRAAMLVFIRGAW
jgi:hypothetical protein